MKFLILLLVIAGLLVVDLGATVESSEHGDLPQVTGDDKINPMDHPYAVRLRLSKKNSQNIRYCGGVRFQNSWILTAAECLDAKKYNVIDILYPVVVGPVKWSVITVKFEPSRAIIHPEYNEDTNANNIGLYYISFDSLVPDYILLPKNSEENATFSDLTAVVSTWTTPISKDDTDHPIMTTYTTHTVDLFWCKLAYFFRSLTSEHICASSWGGKPTTEADVGAPVVIQDQKSNKVELIGIVSSINPWSTYLPVPRVLTKVAPHVKWMRRNGVEE